MTERVLPMFPLGTVLYPHSALPLRIFEPRYLELTADCLAGDRRFGVVLIERGSEVGGGDVRFGVGTEAAILDVAELGEGQLAMVAAGVRRIRVEEWLDDDPYPRAIVTPAPDEGPPPTGAVEAAVAELRRVLALATELGADVGAAEFELDRDPAIAGYQACALAPLGPLDAQSLLETEPAATRVEALTALLRELAALLRMQLEGK